MHLFEGVQQGHPLDVILSCFTIHNLFGKLNSDFVIFYFYDGTVGGERDKVIQNLLTSEKKACLVGLGLNRLKTELI